MTLATDLAIALDPESIEVAGKSSPLALARYDLGSIWIDSAYQEMLNEALIWATTTHAARLIITMPPRHGKTTLASRYLPAWHTGTYPNKRVGVVSYGGEFAAEHGAEVRDIIARHGTDLWGIKLKEDSKAKHKWNVDGFGGGMWTAGADGAITGKGYDLGIIDDPIKNREEADSKTERDKLRRWYPSTFLNRRDTPAASIIVMMTRWREDDFIGWLLGSREAKEADKQGEGWELLNLPALAEAEDPLGREVGEALWPERWPVDELAKIKRESGSVTWDAMYQQRPHPAEGGLFKSQDFRRYRVEYEITSQGGVDVQLQYLVLLGENGAVRKRWPSTDCWRFGIFDPAASIKEKADYSVMSSFIVTPENQLLIFDIDRQKAEGPDQPKMMHRAWKKNDLGDIGIETVAYQLALFQAASREGLPVREVKAKGDKYSRALSAAARNEAGELYLPESASWLSELEDELLSFPTGAHDDQVDTIAYAAIRVASGAMDAPVDTPGSIWAL